MKDVALKLVLDSRVVDGTRRVVLRSEGGSDVLSKLELDAIVYLVERRGTNVSRAQLLRHVWGYREGLLTRAVDAVMFKLRAKLELDPRRPRYLFAVRGVGYRYEGPPFDEEALAPAAEASASAAAAETWGFLSAFPEGADLEACAAALGVATPEAWVLLEQGMREGALEVHRTGRPTAYLRWRTTGPVAEARPEVLERLDAHWSTFTSPEALRELGEQADTPRGLAHRRHDREAIRAAIGRAWDQGLEARALCLVLLHAEIAVHQGPWPEAEAELRMAVAAAEGADPILRARLRVQHARVLGLLGRTAEAAAVLEPWVDTPSPEVEVDRWLVLGSASARSTPGAGEHHTEQAALIAEASQDPYLLGRVALRRAQHASNRGELGQAVAAYDQADRLLERAQAPSARALALGNRGVVYTWTGDVAEARSALDRSLDFYQTRANHSLAAGVRVHLATALYLSGEGALAHNELDAAIAGAKLAGDARTHGFARLRKAHLLGYQDEQARALSQVRAAVALLEGAHDPRLLCLAHATQAEVLAALGRPEAAARAWARVEVRALDPASALEATLASCAVAASDPASDRRRLGGQVDDVLRQARERGAKSGALVFRHADFVRRVLDGALREARG